MRVLVVGLGSMGKRRIRLLKKHSAILDISGVDRNVERCRNIENEFNIPTYSSIEEALDDKEFDCVFVATAPLSHALIINTCLRNHLHVFTEINLVNDGYLDNMALAKKMKCVLFLSSTFLYRQEIKRIQKEVKKVDEQLIYTYHVGQYLPDWHPWENYKDFFVGDPRTNGCREIFAIELPWLIEVFGDIDNVEVRKSKITHLNIGFPDNYEIIIKHKNGNTGILLVDIVSREACRNIEIMGESIYLKWNGRPDGLEIFDFKEKKMKNIKVYDTVNQLSDYASFVIENAYDEEIIAFFNAVSGRAEMTYTFSDDLKTLEWIDRIEVK